MAISSKYIKLHQNVLLEWTYNSENLKQEDYQVVQDLIENKRGYMSKTGLNRVDNTLFVIDPVIKKYAKVDVSKYNQLKIENYTTSFVQFDKLRIHLPTSYSFSNNGYIGMYVRVYTYDYTNKTIIDFSSYLYDDTDLTSSKDLTLNQEFYYDEQSWGKYITYDIPSINEVSKQRTSSVNTNLPSTNSINANLSQSNGISETSPIFIEFSFVVSRQQILGNTYYHMSDIFTKSITKVPEYLDLAANIIQATDGDYFWIYGSYGGNNESMDEFVSEMYSKGRNLKIEYEINLYEENLLMNTQTILVTENFTQKMWYRPVLSFTNTTASIDVTMRIIDLVDESTIDRLASISLTTDIFKYGKKLTRINLDNAFKPKIYNLKNTATAPNIEGAGNITLTKVNYPVISDRINILVESSPSNDSSYKSMGLAEIIINPFGNTITFNIASSDSTGTITPYNLTKITENATLTLSFKNDTDFLEKTIWMETDINSFEHGIVVYRIEQSDIPIIKNIGATNKNFYLTIKSEKTGVRSLLYSGKWVYFDNLTFTNKNTTSTNTNIDTSNSSKIDSFKESVATQVTISKPKPFVPDVSRPTTNQNSNAMVFLKSDANIKIFDEYLYSINANIYLRKPGGNSDTLTYLYYLLNLTPAIIQDIKNQIAVLEVVPIAFNLGNDKNDTKTINIKQIENSVISFNNNNQINNAVATAKSLKGLGRGRG